MQVPVQVVLKKVPRPRTAREEVMKAAQVLERFHPRITACRVAITNPDVRHVSGGLFDVHIVLQLPGRPDVIVSRRAGDRLEGEHLSVALRKAFAQARRRLQDSVRRLRGDVKAHARADTGRAADKEALESRAATLETKRAARTPKSKRLALPPRKSRP